MIFATRSAAKFHIAATFTNGLRRKHRVVPATRNGEPCGFTVVMVLKPTANGGIA